MPNIDLYYFTFTGLGEPVRLLLAYGGEDWKDHRLTFAEWPDFKPKTPFGQVPLMVIDGKEYAQSTAICRYLGRKYGLAGADLEEDFLIDQIVDFITDIKIKASVVHFEPDEAYKAKKHEEYTKNVYPPLLDKLDEILQANNGHMALGKLTWADFMFAGAIPGLKMIMQAPDLDTRYPSFKQIEQKIHSFPKVKAYVDAAPKGEF